MSDWITVAKTNEIAESKWKVVDVDGTSVMVFNLGGKFFAIENVCTHDGGTLSDGHLEGDEIVCPRHGAKFCVKTGAVMAPPAYEDVVTFAVRIQNDEIQVRDARFD